MVPEELSQALPLPRMEPLMPPCYSPRNSTDSKAKIDPSPLHIIWGIFCHTQLGVHSMLALIHFSRITQNLTLMIATIVSSHDQSFLILCCYYSEERFSLLSLSQGQKRRFLGKVQPQVLSFFYLYVLQTFDWLFWEVGSILLNKDRHSRRKLLKRSRDSFSWKKWGVLTGIGSHWSFETLVMGVGMFTCFCLSWGSCHCLRPGRSDSIHLARFSNGQSIIAVQISQQIFLNV